jgi:hypothetical protein
MCVNRQIYQLNEQKNSGVPEKTIDGLINCSIFLKILGLANHCKLILRQILARVLDKLPHDNMPSTTSNAGLTFILA